MNAVGEVREGLKVEHIMRTNVKMIHAADRFDDVMHFVERSRFNHFPVVDEDNVLVGVIHFADLRDILYDPAIRDLITAGDLDLDEAELGLQGSYTQVVDVFPPVQKHGGTKLEGLEPEVAARKIAAYLREEKFI